MLIDQIIDNHYHWAFVASALAALIVAGLTHRAHKKADIATLRPLVEALRGDGVMADAAAIVAAARNDPWSVLADKRDASCAVLRRLGRAAREVDNPRAWETVIDGAEYAALTEFLDSVTPLILVLRLTTLEMNGPERPYNDDKVACAKAAMTALGCRVRVRVLAALRALIGR